MKQMKSMALMRWIILLVLAMMVLAGCKSGEGKITEVPSEDTYSYVNPDETKAETDKDIVIDGVLDEEVYKKNNWLYLHNEDGGNNVNIAMTSYYGQKGMYFVFDVTESVPIYVNLDRSSFMNSCIEMYLAPFYVSSMQDNDVFEIDLMPTGDMLFKRGNGKISSDGNIGYGNVASTNDIMACLGTTTKGGEVNTASCYGYCLELFIPWDYMQWLGVDTDALKDGFVYINPAHITSYNLMGTDTKIDRLWYHYAQQNGAKFADVSRYFQFNGHGVMGSVPLVLQQGEHYTISGAASVIPGMNAFVTVKPDEGYALTSVMLNDEEQIQNISFNEDGSVTLTIYGTKDGATISAKAEAVTEGAKTLSGKVVLNNINKDSLAGLLLSYIGPKGEKPLDFDNDGNFELKDMEQGYYILKAEKEGYASVSRSICLNQDFYTELVLEYDFFQVVQGSSWILDDQNDGILYKKEGYGQILSNTAYSNFTFRANLKYDPQLAKLGTSDDYTQQRTGMQIRFSNGKTWHIDMLKEKGKYILQYAKISGDNSVTDWKTIHTLDAGQIGRYTGKSGIQLSIMRQGNYAVIWLDDELIKIEILDEKYDHCSAQLGFESWASNRELLKLPFSIANHSTVNVKGSPFLDHAESWNISDQYQGKVHKQGTQGVYTWLDSVILTNDVTTVARDLSPDTKDYSLAYIFKFSNGEQLRIRLHHTDADGVYRIQTMNGSTVVPAWKVGYDLTDEQAAKIKGDGIEYRVALSGATAHVYIGGEEVCTYDLSKVIASGNPSGVDKATAKVSFSLDGNYGKTTELPFKIVDTGKDVMISVTDAANGAVTADKTSCKIGQTVKLTIAGDPGYYYTDLCINGQKIDPNWDGTYSFKATENVYIITAEFGLGHFQENTDSSWNVFKQNQDLLYMNSHKTGDSGWLSAQADADDISATVRDTAPAAKDFAMVYHFDFSNGEALRLCLHHTGTDGKYAVQVMDGSTLSVLGEDIYTLTDAEAAKLMGDGISFRTWIDGTNAIVYLDERPVCTIDLSKVVSTGNASGVGEATVRVKLSMEGNLKQALEIPFKLIDSSKRVFINIDEMPNGKVTTQQANYQIGDTVTLTVAPDASYSQKLYINGEPLLLDWKTNTYSFEATEAVYNITGSFEQSLNATAKDGKRWDTANQAHGIFNAYYPNNDDAWLLEIKEECRAISVKAKNYLAGEDGKGIEGFAVNLGFKLNNKDYIFRIIRQNGKYYHQRFGINGSDWTKTELDSAAIEAICGEGADYKLERTAADTLTLSVNGVVYDTYKVDGASENTKVTAAIIGHYGNKGEKIEIPFVLKKITDAPDVKLDITPMTNGTVVFEYASYQVGEVITLRAAPASGYILKSLVVKHNGAAVDIGTIQSTGGSYSFVAEYDTYTVEAEFAESIFNVVNGDWDLSNQFNGSITINNQKNGSTVITEASNYKEVSVVIKDYTPSKNEDGSLKQGDFAAQLYFIFDDGKQYQVRIHNTDKDGNYKLQNMGEANSLTAWKWQADLTTAQKAKLIDGDGVEFAVKLVGSNAELWVDGTRMKTVALGANYAGKLAQIKICMNGNNGVKNMEIPFTLKPPTDAPEIKLNIADMTNGTVVSERQVYQVGDTVTLLVTPNAGYSQKLYINGEPMMMDYETNTCKFVASQEIYNITGSFEPGIFDIVRGSWNLINQHHGILAIDSQKDGTTVITKANNYKELSVTVKDHTPSKNADGSLKQGNFSVQLYFIFDDGKQYQVRLHNTDKDGNYKLQNMGEANSLTGWKWQADLTTAQKQKLLEGDGVEFSVKLAGSNAELWVDGTLMKTVSLGANYDGKLAQIRICVNGNNGVENLQIPFTLE